MGFVGVGYKEALQEKGRILQAALLYLFSASSATYSCPLAMKEERYTLYGVKWFTSATTSEMALTLARIEGEAGLTLFCVELERKSGKGITGIVVNRLKDKLGTKALPTAELTLEGVLATRIGPLNRGVASIANMLNVTRYYNAVASASLMTLSILQVREYAKLRRAFSKAIGEHVMFQNTLAGLESLSAAAMSICFEVAQLLGKVEAKKANQEETVRLRALIPIAKLLLGKQVVTHTSETLECFGGAGYIEDTGFPRLLRDAQVLPIWEGTTNVLSLDVLRAEKKQKAFQALLHNIESRLGCMRDIDQAAADVVYETAKHLQHKLKELQGKSENEVEGFARRMSMTAGLLLQSVLLAEAVPYAVSGDDSAAQRLTVFVENQLCGPLGV